MTTLTTTLLEINSFLSTNLLSVIVIAFGISTIVIKNSIYSIFSLIGLFLAISLYLVNFNLDFIALSYILVYVGAISILFLFILMLINVRTSELATENRNSAVLSMLVIIFFTLTFSSNLPGSMNIEWKFLSFFDRFLFDLSYLFYSKNVYISSDFSYAENLVSKLSSFGWDISLAEISHISAIGFMFYSVLFIVITILGFILLLAIVGCISVTVKAKDNISEYNLTKSPDYLKLG